jgi:hypothetical protein
VTVYAPYTWKSLATVRHKVEDDFRGALAAWPTMRGWRLVHNDMHGLHAPVAAALEDLRAEASRSMSEVQILPPWGPNELCWLLRQAPRSAQWAILGAPAWHASRLPLGDLTDDPVQVAAGRSVAQLIDNFPPGGVCEPIAATSLASALAAFLLGDQAMFEARVSMLAQRCEDEPFEPMLTAVVFCAKAIDQWESASKCPARLLTDGWIATGQANEYVIDLVLAAREGVDPPAALPGHRADQQHLTTIFGRLTAATLRLVAEQYGLVNPAGMPDEPHLSDQHADQSHARLADLPALGKPFCHPPPPRL